MLSQALPDYYTTVKNDYSIDKIYLQKYILYMLGNKILTFM